MIATQPLAAPVRLAVVCATWLMAIAVLFCCGQATAQPLNVQLSSFIHTVWTARDGVPAKVFVMAQTEDGWLWLGGSSGLYQFDGIKFREIRADGGKRRLSVSVLYAMPSGELVIGLVGGGFAVYQHAGLTLYDGPEMHRAGRVQDFVRDGSGMLWAFCDNAVLRFDGRQWAAVGQDWNYSGGGALSATLDRRGALWIASAGRIWKLASGSKQFEIAVSNVDGLVELVQSPDGLTWLQREKDSQVLPDQEPGPIDMSESRRLNSATIFDSKGVYWSWQPGRGLPYPRVEGIDAHGNHLTTLMEDRQQNIWYASVVGELHRYRRPKLSTVSLPALGPDVAAAAVVPQGEKVWISLKAAPTFGGVEEGVWLFDSALRRVQPGLLSSGGAITRDPDGAIWYANQNALWRLNGDRFEQTLALPSIWGPEPPTSLAANCAGGIWIANPGTGLWRHDGTSWQRKGGVSALPDEAPSRQVCDATRRLWLGYQDGTLIQIDRGRVNRMDSSRGLAVGGVTDISVGAHVFVAGERGLALLVGERFESLRAARPSAFEGLTGIAESPDGDVWVNGASGMARVRAADLPTSATALDRPMPVELFDTGDGYPGPAFTRPLHSPLIATDAKSRVWVSGIGGIAYFDSRASVPSSTAARALIRAFSVNDVSYATNDTLDLPKGTRTLGFEYTALDYTHPERLRFRHRLEGIDSDWIVDESRREANYANLGPGSYRFLVEASDETGAWQTESTSMALTIAPTFWQSRYFKGLLLLTLIVLAAFAHRLRLRQVAGRERRLLEERLFERERIARELHDTLLQGTQALIIKIHALALALPADGPLRRRLGDAVEVAQQAMNEARDRIQALRSGTGTPEDLEAMLAATGNEIVRSADVAFESSIQGSPRTLKTAVAEAVHLIVKEALRNAIQHANAQAIEVQVIYANDALRVMVRDDGSGIDEARVTGHEATRHWGLKGMQERAREIGAVLTIWARADAGTEIELRVPSGAAYQRLRKSLRH